MAGLLPCPFCGGEAHMLIGKMDDGGKKYQIGCYDPDCAGSAFEATVFFFFEEEAIAAWNRRAERTCRDFGGEEGTNGEGYDFACSACGYCCDLPEPDYCPRCGARVVCE